MSTTALSTGIPTTAGPGPPLWPSRPYEAGDRAGPRPVRVRPVPGCLDGRPVRLDDPTPVASHAGRHRECIGATGSRPLTSSRAATPSCWTAVIPPARPRRQVWPWRAQLLESTITWAQSPSPSSGAIDQLADLVTALGGHRAHLPVGSARSGMSPCRHPARGRGTLRARAGNSVAGVAPRGLFDRPAFRDRFLTAPSIALPRMR